MDIWTVIAPYFSKREAWGEHKKINPVLLYVFYLLRREVGYPFSVHPYAYDTTGHATDSEHYKGNAVDFHVVGIPLLEAEEAIECGLRRLQLWEYVGLGIYPDWNNPGFHLDVRGFKARWARIGSEYVAYESGVQHAEKKSQ